MKASLFFRITFVTAFAAESLNSVQTFASDPFGPADVRPDCSEKSISIQELENIVLSKEVHNMQDFLERIPKDSMQNFTFVYNSRSIQRGSGEGQVSPLWPRVLRSTIDGKVTLSFVCNPKNQSYGKVEVLYFNETNEEINSAEFDFTSSRPGTTPSSKIQHSPQTCITCHSGSSFRGLPSLKHIWPEYYFWGDCVMSRGISVYGSSDDSLDSQSFRPRLSGTPEGCDEHKDQEAHIREVANWYQFRKLQRDNACFNTLPWPRKQPQPTENLNDDSNTRSINKFKTYPYNDEVQGDIGDQRPNFRFSMAFSRWNARRIVNLLKTRTPNNFVMAQYLLAMEEARCINDSDRALIQKTTGINIKSGTRDGSTIDFYSGSDIRETYPVLYGFGKLAGLEDEDWTLNFLSKGDPNYNAGEPTSLAALIEDKILAEIAESNPNIKKQIKIQKLKDYPCLDKVVPIIFDPFFPSYSAPSESLCTLLRTEYKKHLELFQATSGPNPCKMETPSMISEQFVNDIPAAIKFKGKEKTLNQTPPKAIQLCIDCHNGPDSSPMAPNFPFNAPNKLKSVLAKPVSLFDRRNLIDVIHDRLNRKTEDEKRMPQGKIISDEEKEELEIYFRHLLDPHYIED